ncbi:MAG TPA: PQQ-dependent sugar dehydrogenase [Oligoflexia bacterium]|nr:PQQ-dependent sugar dehydrogenase [Oligoflexia bacterium]HMP47567.1 PQQ-dependent sugar dehydrogenase [Oligoflexia bacterium]
MLVTSCGGGGGGGGGISIQGSREVLVSDLSFPVRIGELDSEVLIFSELSTGKVSTFNKKSGDVTELIRFPGFLGSGLSISGLMVDREFERNGFVFLYHGTAELGKNVLTRLEIKNGKLAGRLQLRSFSSPSVHNGGGMYQFSNGNILLGIGDGNNPALAQDVNRVEGKILLINRNGDLIDSSNGLPGGIYALGFRNPFGIDGDGDGVIFVADNGPECDDKIARLVSGGNYGWRMDYQCGVNIEGHIQPEFLWAKSEGLTDILLFKGLILVPHFNTNRLLALKFTGAYSGVTEEIELISNGTEPIIDLLKTKNQEVLYTTPKGILRLK